MRESTCDPLKTLTLENGSPQILVPGPPYALGSSLLQLNNNER